MKDEKNQQNLELYNFTLQKAYIVKQKKNEKRLGSSFCPPSKIVTQIIGKRIGKCDFPDQRFQGEDSFSAAYCLLFLHQTENLKFGFQTAALHL